jgi:hypothetical protein
MRRIASHHIFWKQLYRLHYIELSDNGVFLGVSPLCGEIPATEFYDGLLLPAPVGAILTRPLTPEQIRQSGITEHVSPGDRIHLYRIHRGIIDRFL